LHKENFDNRIHIDSPALLHSGRDVKRASADPVAHNMGDPRVPW